MSRDAATPQRGSRDLYHRLSNGTLTKWRKEEVWLQGKNSYESPVPHTERLEPVDFLTCTNMACGFHATPESVASLKKALSFARQFKANKCIIHMEVGGALEGQLPGGAVLEQLKTQNESPSSRARTGWSSCRTRKQR
mmetsp:Transcript_32257/g.58335  ORF Transcript_32257/g.58335 Transcript_32257/m.58335 type:complete len:138 (-) Transcript_32257:7-420(-)